MDLQSPECPITWWKNLYPNAVKVYGVSRPPTPAMFCNVGRAVDSSVAKVTKLLGHFSHP